MGTGPGAAGTSGATINIAAVSPGTGLDFDGATNTINLNALIGSKGLTYNVSAPITISGTTTFTNTTAGTATFNFSGGISGNFNIIKTGTSKLTLIGPSTYTGGTAVNNGKLIVGNSSGSVTGTGAVTVGDMVSGHTATLSVLGTTANPVNATISGLVTINGAGSGTAGTIAGVVGSTLNLTGGLVLQSGSLSSFTLGTPNGTSGPAMIATSGTTNSLVVSGTHTISFANPSIGTYDLFSYTGSTTFADFKLSGASVSANSGLSFQLLNGAGQIDLQVSVLPVNWSGTTTVGGVTPWDTVTQNWATATGAAANYTDPNGTVAFADTYATASGPVPVVSSNVAIQSAGVTPSQVTFNNSVVNYVLSDVGTNGILGSTGIVKNGSGTLTFTSPNSFSGAIAINGGQLNIGNSNEIGTTSGITVAFGAALQLQGGATIGSIPLSIAGPGLTGNASGALQNVSGANTYGGPIVGSGTITSSSATPGDGLTLTGGVNITGSALTINGAGNTTINTVGISGIGSLTYSGSGTLALNAANTFSGGTTLTSGTIRAGTSSVLSGSAIASSPLGLGAAALNGGTLQDNGSAITLANPVSLNGNVTFSSSGSGSLTFDGTALTTPATFNIAGSSSLTVNNTTTINDAVTGSSTLAIGGTGTLILGGSDSFSGTTTIGAGSVVQIDNPNARAE